MQGFLKWNHRSGRLEIPEEVDLTQQWDQFDTLLQALTLASKNNIPFSRIDGIDDIKKAAMSNVSVTVVAVPRTSIYQAPTLVIGAHMFTVNPRAVVRNRIEYRVYWNDEYVHSHARKLADSDVPVGVCPLCLNIGVSDDEHVRLSGFAFSSP